MTDHSQDINDLTLGVCKETLTESRYKNLYTNYVTTHEQHLSQCLNGLGDLLFDQSALLLRARFDLEVTIHRLKEDDSYIP